MRDRFLGNYRTETKPAAVERGECAASSELAGIIAVRCTSGLTLDPEKKRGWFLLGVGPRAKGREAKAKYSDLAEVDRAFAALRSYWEEKLAAFQCKTPHRVSHHDQHLDAVPGGNLRGLVAVRIIHRGGRTHRPGYRDTSQDLMSVVHINPENAGSAFSNCCKGR